MVLSDNTSVVDDNKICVEGVDDCSWEFGYLIFGFTCTGEFSSYFLARWNHQQNHKKVPWVNTKHQPQLWARSWRYHFGMISK